MKIKGKVEIKPDITMFDIGNIVEAVAQFIIRRTDDDKVVYTPYYEEQGTIYAITSFLITGIEPEGDEDAITIYENDKVVRDLVDGYIAKGAEMDDIRSMLYDVVDFRKKLYTQTSDTLRDELVKVLKKERALNDALLEMTRQQGLLIEKQLKESIQNEEIMSSLSPDELTAIAKRFAIGDMDAKQMVGTIAEKYIVASGDEKTAKLIDDKNKKIKELEKYKAFYEGRNVEADSADDGK